LNWITYFFSICDTVAKKSKDPSTKVGSIIVGPIHEIRSTGYNGFPRGVHDTESRLKDREMKYRLTIHAELNAILSAARNGVSLEDCILYTQWYPCHECAKAIIQAGIKHVIISGSFLDVRGTSGWEESFKTAKEMFNEAKVGVKIYTTAQLNTMKESK